MVASTFTDQSDDVAVEFEVRSYMPIKMLGALLKQLRIESYRRTSVTRPLEALCCAPSPAYIPKEFALRLQAR